MVVDIEKGTVSGWLRVTLSDGSFFSLPSETIHANGWEQPGTPADPDIAARLQQQAWQQLIERKALDSLARAEQCRARLQLKLIAKGMPAAEVSQVLDELEQRNVLSDRRYAESWVRNRMLRRGEGPLAVQLGLRARGIDQHTARAAIDTLQQEYPDLLEQAIQRAAARLSRSRSTRSPEALRSRLLREGFPRELVDTELKKYQI
ncbi:hypothetical protein Spiaf_0667 [Spirochaeta africana DSM 8902]|uniref:Regulatory protein RecX n=1 Tax=Spirochaeta africana (strain ATCC 700263 / DSM 8902 / Z-7692) TaxID=889378 RepID=H9UGX4_SPIAZ|nr:hypothetical protein Spiaf_0667 [Spirochaeta africana DSM 8902]